MARKIEVFSRFNGGEYGALGDWNAPDNSFTANNMFVTRKGELCVRPGVKAITPSGVASGVVQAFGVTSVPLNDVFYVQGTAVRTFSSGGDNLKTSGTALAETPATVCDWKNDGATILFASSADKIYRLTPQTGVTVPTVAGLTGSPGANAIEVYGDRIIAGGIDGGSEFELRFSAAANPNSWTASDFIMVGDAWGVTGLHSQRQHLLIVKQNSMHILTGVPGVNPILRKVYTGITSQRPQEGRLAQEDLLMYQGIFHKFPSFFNGTSTKEFDYLEYTTQVPNDGGTFPPGHGVAPFGGRDKGGVFVANSGDRMIMNMNEVWTYHTLGVTTSGYVAPADGSVFLCDGGGAGAAPNFWVWNPGSDAPGIEGNDRVRAGDASSTSLSGSVTFPEWWAENSAEVYVRAVIVDFRTWATGSATNNHFDLTVTNLRRFDAAGGQASSTVSFDQAAASSSATGTLQRRTFGFGEQGLGNGFQLAFTACKGMAFHRIQVILDAEPYRA